MFILVSITSYAQLPAAGDCIDAIRLCDQNQIYHYEANGPGAIDDANGALDLFCQSQTSVTEFESDSAWFKFTVNYSGEFGFVIQPDTVEDFEYMLFLDPDCNDLANPTNWVRCDTAQTPPNVGTGDEHTGIGDHPIFGGGDTGSVAGFTTWLNVTAGETYYLFVTPYFTTGRSFRLWFQGDVFLLGNDVLDHPECALSTDEFTKPQVAVYPNPTNGVLQIDTQQEYERIAIYNILGQELRNQDFTTKLDLSKYQSGVYFLKVFDQQGRSTTLRVVKAS